MSTERSGKRRRARIPLRLGLRAGLALGVVAACAGCRNDRVAPARVVSPRNLDLGGTSTELVTESFDELYPRFLAIVRDAGNRAGDWQTHFAGRYVRWQGRIASFTPNGMTIRIRRDTPTYDISVTVDREVRPRLRLHHVGDEITFVGRLVRYDDVFSQLYMDHGDIVDEATPPTP